MRDLFSDSEPRAVCPVDGDVLFYPEPPWTARASALFEQLHSELEWREGFVNIFGKSYKQPRLFAWYGDADASYAYSGTRYEPNPWTPTLLELRLQLEALCDCSFNSVLANLYRDGADGMGLHADDEPELGSEPTIASLSFGAPRAFRFKHKRRKDIDPIRLTLASGSLLLMRGATQQHWKHEVPKTKKPCGPRVNLTFRRIVPDARS